MEEKMSLLTCNEQYRLWPRQTLQKVAQLISWVRYPPASSIISVVFYNNYCIFNLYIY